MAAVTFRELVLDDVERLLPGGAKATTMSDRLRRAGASVPVAAALAAALDRLAEGDAPALLDLLRMLRPVRATFTGTRIDGALEPLPQSGPWSTAVPAPDLPRLVRWLRRPDYWDDTKDVRFFLMRHADLRLVNLLLSFLERRSADGEFIAEQFVPPYGPALAPDLLSRLGHADRRLRAQVLLALCGSDGRRGAEVCRARLDDPEISVRVDALRCLRVAAPDEARRTALAWLEGRSTAPLLRAAWQCLKQLKRARASDLRALLRALPRGRDYDAPEVVASVGRPAVRPLAEMLDSPDRATRLAAVSALGHLGVKAAPAVHRLIALLDDREERTVIDVLVALQRIGPAARAAVPRVVELLAIHNTEAGIGYSAGDALVSIGCDDPAAVAALVARLDGKGWDVLFNAVSRVGDVGPAARAAVPRLVALYRSRRSHWQFRMHILEVLAEIGPAADEARPLLEKVLGDREIRLRYGAALALAMTGPEGKAGVPVLIEAMHDERDSWWWSMHGEKGLFALGNVGPAAAAAVPALAEAARTEFSGRRRRLAREALAKVRGKA